MIFQIFNSPPKHSFVCNADSSLCSPADKLFSAQKMKNSAVFTFFLNIYGVLCVKILATAIFVEVLLEMVLALKNEIALYLQLYCIYW